MLICHLSCTVTTAQYCSFKYPSRTDVTEKEPLLLSMILDVPCILKHHQLLRLCNVNGR